MYKDNIDYKYINDIKIDNIENEIGKYLKIFFIRLMIIKIIIKEINNNGL